MRIRFSLFKREIACLEVERQDAVDLISNFIEQDYTQESIEMDDGCLYPDENGHVIFSPQEIAEPLDGACSEGVDDL